MTDREFTELVWQHYDPSGRSMPWRENTAPYWVVVSELMLQQTQASRVIPKFNLFIDVFPSFEKLANASLGDVLEVWVGLGYNRRAKFLHEAAKRVTAEHNGKLPSNYEQLVALPGIGPNTAGAILAYAFNQPVTYIETNIRTVYIHNYFTEAENVADTELLPLIERTVDTERPREWYWALMDYGVSLKKSNANPSRRSKHHVKQSKFEGSDRQVRGAILKLLANGAMNIDALKREIDDTRLPTMLSKLHKEGMIVLTETEVRLP